MAGTNHTCSRTTSTACGHTFSQSSCIRGWATAAQRALRSPLNTWLNKLLDCNPPEKLRCLHFPRVSDLEITGQSSQHGHGGRARRIDPVSWDTTKNIPSCGSPCPTQVSLSYTLSLHPATQCVKASGNMPKHLSHCVGVEGPSTCYWVCTWRGGAGPRSHCQA